MSSLEMTFSWSNSRPGRLLTADPVEIRTKLASSSSVSPSLPSTFIFFGSMKEPTPL